MNETLMTGLTLLGMGMGFVLCFLCILIGAMFGMSAIVRYLNKLFPEAIEEVKTTTKKVAANVDEAIAVAIAAVLTKRS